MSTHVDLAGKPLSPVAKAAWGLTLLMGELMRDAEESQIAVPTLERLGVRPEVPARS